MNEAGARHVPVVEDERVVGMITLDDLVRHLAGESAHVAAQMDNVAGIIRAEFTDG
jgi:CBS domain-containing protein